MTTRIERIGDATLYLGDCREILPTLGGVDAVVTDPPYGISYVTNYRKRLETPEMLANDDEAPLWSVQLMADRMAPGSAMYLCTRFDVSADWSSAIISAGLQVKTPIIWDKTNHTAGDLDGDYGAQVEFVLFAHKGRHLLRNGREPNLWRHARPVAGIHPTPKPVDLMARMVRNSTDIGSIVLDPFMGSGTTGVACAKLGRKFVGIEKEPQYFDLACKRIEDAYRQPDMWVEIERPKAKQESFLDGEVA